MVVVDEDEITIVGINTFGHEDDNEEDVEGLNFAVASTEIRAFLREEGFPIDDDGFVQKRAF